MRKNAYLLLLVVTSLFGCVGGNGSQEVDGKPHNFDADGASLALFSVSPDRQVRFSQGNLQYQASTATWRFAERQYDYIDKGNKNISSSYDGWIDLFGWGTSGWQDSGAKSFQPYHKSTDAEDYYVGGSCANDLTGAWAKADWGEYNAISNGGAKSGMWRMLSKEEWFYMMEDREASLIEGKEGKVVARRVRADVCGVKGLIVFPDKYEHPEGVKLLSGVGAELTFACGEAVPFSGNKINNVEWIKMERAGCVFLPAAGGRVGSDVSHLGTNGGYWTSSANKEFSAWCLYFNTCGESVVSSSRRDGRSVRLVKDCE